MKIVFVTLLLLSAFATTSSTALALETLSPGLYECRTLKDNEMCKTLRVSKKGSFSRNLAPGLYRIYHSKRHGDCFIVAVPTAYSAKPIAVARYDTLYKYAHNEKIKDSELSYDHVIADCCES